MDIRSIDDGPVEVRGGQVSHLLFAPALGASNLTVTWVQGKPGSQQPLHAHAESEQVYIIVRGEGMMIVDGEEERVVARSAVRIPPGATHAIRNIGSTLLEYVAATAPPLDAHVLWRGST